MTDDPILLDNFIKKQNKIEANESPMPTSDSKKYNWEMNDYLFEDIH